MKAPKKTPIFATGIRRYLYNFPFQYSKFCPLRHFNGSFTLKVVNAKGAPPSLFFTPISNFRIYRMIVASVFILQRAIAVRAMQLNGAVSSDAARSLSSLLRRAWFGDLTSQSWESAERQDRYMR